MQSPKTWHVISILMFGIFAVSLSAIFVRLATEAANTQGIGFSLFLASLRLILSALILLPIWVNFKPVVASISAYYYAIGAGLCLAVHFAVWITSLSYTSIAASTTLVTTNPVWVSLLSWVWFREKLSKLTILGIVIALLGGILLAWGDSYGNSENLNPLLGDSLALVGAWMVSLYLLLGREAQRRGLGVGRYSAIAYTIAAVTLFPFPLLFGENYTGHSSSVYIYVLLMAIFPQLIGHTSINWSVRWLSPTFVTLGILFEPVGASGLGWLIFGEVPPLIVIVGATVLLGGISISILGAKQ